MMRFRSRGLLVGGVDHELYVPRPALEAALLRPMEAGGNVLIVGPAGAGKTTALRKLEADLSASATTNFVNAALAESTVELLELIAEHIGVIAPAPSGVLTAVRRLSDAEPRCILLDGPVPASIGRELFGRFRDELWALEHQWALTSTPQLATAVRTPPADAFWDQVIALPQLTDEEVQELVARGVDSDEAYQLADEVQWIPAARWPRDVVRNTRAFLEPTALTAPDVVQELRDKQAQLDRTPAMVLAELQSMRRPTAAGDSEFLQRLGYSRAYVARALVELEKLGLVQSVPESTENKTGRPQKLYEPTIAEFV